MSIIELPVKYRGQTNYGCPYCWWIKSTNLLGMKRHLRIHHQQTLDKWLKK